MYLLARYKAWQIWWCSVIILPVWGYIQWRAFCFQVALSYSTEGSGGKKGRNRSLYNCRLKWKGENNWEGGCWGFGAGKRLNLHYWGKAVKGGRRGELIPCACMGWRCPLPTSPCTCAHMFSWMPWDPSLLLGIWTKLIHVKDGLSLEYIKIPGTLAGVRPRYWADLMLSSLLKWAKTESRGGQVIYYFGHWPLSQLPILTVFATRRFSVAFQKV